MQFSRDSQRTSGFTLIELSIVLVIIGLIVGGILTGRDLIAAATIRAQVSQIEKLQSAVNTFKGKYGYLPGDIPNPVAGQYGFITRGSNPGEGDGNGILEGIDYDGPADDYGFYQASETLMFWNDLSVANFINGNYTAYTNMTNSPNIQHNQVSSYFPPAAIGRGNYLYVFSGGWKQSSTQPGPSGDGRNYFGLSAIDSSLGGDTGMYSYAGLTTLEARNIDAKIDDGLPQSGHVLTLYVSEVTAWAPPGGFAGPGSGPYTTATSGPGQGIMNTCYDNNNTAGAVQQYSVANPNGINCVLSFQFQ